MIICLCRAKSDKDISRAIEAGASSIRDLQECGKETGTNRKVVAPSVGP